jgi:hypothetical protein
VAQEGVGQLVSRRRLLLVHVVIAVLVLGTARDVLLHEEHWPFSHYAMFSAVDESRWFESLRLFGVTADGQGREFPLRAYAHLQPLDQCRVSTALSWMRHRPDGEARVQDVARRVYERYERLRRANGHDGPALKAVRIYHLGWQLDPWARNADTPDRRDLVTEYAPGRGEP